MDPQQWFAELRAELPATAPELEDDEIDALLDLARVAAHTAERWTAPISTFVVGAALADLSGDHRAARIRELTARLEAEVPGAAPADGGPPPAPPGHQ